MSYVNLHCHTSYSQLDGASKIPELVARCKELGMPAVAITDHGHLNGIIDLYREANKHELKPILGQEFYFADDRFNKESIKQDDSNAALTGSDKRYYHLTILAQDNVGYHNLLKLSSDAFLNGFYYKPRTDYDVLSEHREGIVVGSGCLGGPVLQPLLHNDYQGAYEAAGRLRDIVGKENFFIELMDHGLLEQKQTNPYLIDIAQKLDVPVVATMDSHYTHADDAFSHSVLLCCQTGAKLDDPKRFQFENNEYYVKSPEEMARIFSHTPQAVTNSLVIAERCNVEITFGELHLPRFPDIPQEFEDDYAYLEYLAYLNLDDRYDGAATQVYKERIAYELSVIRSLNLSSYFLIFWDLVNFANRERILTGPGRGSAAGSLVSYLLGITKLDPIQHNLIFERFINPDRIALADIDWDIDTRFREKLINYTKEKYGSDQVAQIITFNTMKARTAVRDAARVMGYEFALGDKISKQMPPLVMGFDTPLKACLELDPKYESGYKNAQGLRDLYNNDEDARRIIDVAIGLEGLVRQSGVHAAGVVIGDQRLDNIIPVQQDREGNIITQFNKNIVEDLGLLKMDFLGLRNLDIISDTLGRLGFGFEFLDDLAMDDTETFELLQRGEGVAVFQVESPQMRDLLRRLEPTSIDDIAAVLALYRPGPMSTNMHYDYADRKNHRKLVEYFHPDAKPILESTFGICLYQEQVMEVSKVFAGYSMSEADKLRKIMGKKLPEAMAAEKAKFISGCKAQGYEAEFASELFHMIEGFAAYGFNASHAYSYAYISYWTAYMKVHHPKEYFASLCSAVMNDIDRTAVYLNEARNVGLTVYPPDLNVSDLIYTVEGDGIRIGLGAMKNLGEGAVKNLIAERDVRQFSSLYDFARRYNPNIQAFKSLAYAGALDAFGTRQGIAAIAEDILASTRKENKKNSAQQGSLFAPGTEVDFDVPDTEFNEADLLKHEKETVGIYISGHPLDELKDKKTKYSVDDLKNMIEGNKTLDVLVIVSDLTIKYTKRGDAMAEVILEDQTGSINAVVFPKSWKEQKVELLKKGISYASIKIGRDWKDERNYILLGCKNIDEYEQHNLDSVFGVHLPKKFHLNGPYMSKLKGIVLSHKGNVPLELFRSRSAKLKLSNDYFVNPTDKLKNSITDLFTQYSDELERNK